MEGTINLSLPTDEQGYYGRQCPACELYFKVMPGTGIPNPPASYCAYCGHAAPFDEFFTHEQKQFIESAVVRAVSGQLMKSLKKFEGPLGPQNGFIRMSLSVRETPIPIRYYTERDLETEVECSDCTLKYAIYGVFAYCPDCGSHNSEQVLAANIAVIEKILAISESQEAEIANQLVTDSLVKAVSAFDAFGREAVRVATASRTPGPLGCSFQNLVRARTALSRELGFDLAAGLAPDEWSHAVRCFQKRHLAAHTLGVVDQGYIDVTGDLSTPVGRKMKVNAEEVRSLLPVLKKLAEHLRASFSTGGSQ